MPIASPPKWGHFPLPTSAGVAHPADGRPSMSRASTVNPSDARRYCPAHSNQSRRVERPSRPVGADRRPGSRAGGLVRRPRRLADFGGRTSGRCAGRGRRGLFRRARGCGRRRPDGRRRPARRGGSTGRVVDLPPVGGRRKRVNRPTFGRGFRPSRAGADGPGVCRRPRPARRRMGRGLGCFSTTANADLA